MKWYTIKKTIYIGGLLLMIPFFVNAKSKYEEKAEKYKTHWQKLIPTYSKLQFAGSMGLLSAGIGWDYGKRKQWETDLLIGYVPHYSSSAKATFTIKQNFMPWKFNLGRNISMEPLACGLYINTVLNEDFWVKEPDRYPKGYYNFSTKIRSNIFVGQRFTYNMNSEKHSFAKAVTLFYELSSSDLYIVSASGNNYLKPKDYIHLSLGVKLQIL
ncbi:hypothetical protein [uncultured Bacteroides sp.]|uniref:hypothetical protein n=1 Tax=uncultured Bacteroides sp. TaxID=162156 RepID=UPI002AA6E807|nr:hypothetical protein [uncultured Bacteroides sp.]